MLETISIILNIIAIIANTAVIVLILKNWKNKDE
nr:MAG TPA: transmembrane G protein-coupled receptor [Caudoviricetes sp.]